MIIFPFTSLCPIRIDQRSQESSCVTLQESCRSPVSDRIWEHLTWLPFLHSSSLQLQILGLSVLVAANMTAIATAGVETISTQLNGYLSKDANNTTTTDTSSNSDDSNGDIIESHTRPSRSDLKKAADISLLDADKELHTFKSLYSGDRAARRVLVIFIRHFLCGVSSLRGQPRSMH